MEANIVTSKLIDKYKEATYSLLKLNFPNLYQEELDAAVNWSISKRFKNSNARMENNYKKQTVQSNLLDITEYILSREPIITSFGVIFSRHGSVPNPIYNMVNGFVNDRKKAKKEMFKYPKGSEDYERFNLMQLLYKIDVNGFYGAMGKFSCLYYNVYCASSTTTEGREANAAVSLLFESLLDNNVPFGSLNEVMSFINDVIHEERCYDDRDILDEDISIDECFMKIMTTCGFGYIPDEEDMNIVWDILSKLKTEDINRLFYKNNLFHFIDNSRVRDSLINMLCKLEKPYVDPYDVPEEIKDDLNDFYRLFYEYVYFSSQIIDRTAKMSSLIRSVSILQDTDSSIISLDGWYRYVCDMVTGIDMKIKHTEISYGDESISVSTETYTDYDFINDELIEVEREVNPSKLIPQDGLRFSIINIMAYCISHVSNDFMINYSKNSNSYDAEHHSCFLSLKNEFLFSRVLNTDAKKNYASYTLLQEGHVVPSSQALDIKGLPAFVKSTMNPTTRERLKGILVEDILKADNIDQVRVIKDIAKVEKEIFNSIQNGERLYYKPANIKSLARYDDPLRIQGIKASLVYNALKDDGMATIDLEARNSIIIIKVNIDSKNVDRIKTKYPRTYIKILELLSKKEFSGTIDAIAIPENEEVPKWILEFVDYTAIINDNVNLFPLESIGLKRGNKNVNYTNIIQF